MILPVSRWYKSSCKFFPVSWVHNTQTLNNSLWFTQIVTPCGIRTHYTMLHDSQLPSDHTNHAVFFNSVWLTISCRFYI
ncbi:hypothetical protein SFRURICE_008338 [Spodoptera frugiperda]|nr:hypothetical protein SFRURICE_008338 [Spodoptera frugiperda]